MKLPHSPEDRRVRNEALAHLGRRGGALLALVLVVGLFAHALGVPWFLIAVAIVFIAYHVLFQS